MTAGTISEKTAKQILKSRLRRLRSFTRFSEWFGDREIMIVLAVIIGIGGGLGAVFFRWLIGEFQVLAWGPGGTPLEKILRAPWYWRLLTPVAGGLLVGLIVRYFAPEAKGHGVPEVMNAVARQGGVIRPIVVVAKSVASAICIATGGSIGREGPIVQVGSAMGSTLAQWLRLSTARIRTCVGCGAAAGIAATFNAPIAGAFFAAEVILGEFGVGAFSSVVVSSVSATVISRVILGNAPAFDIPAYSIVSPAEMITYVALGLLAGATSVAFVLLLNTFEEFFNNLKRLPGAMKPMIGGLLIGAMAIVLPQIMGVGYDTITDALYDRLDLGLLVVILIAKLIATTLTLGSGGSGGIFAPSLLMGAALGGAVGHAAHALFPFSMAPPGAYAVVGMGAMVAAATHAPITAILIIFELTSDYRVILALMISCILATILAQRLNKASIYTIKLMRRGIDLMAGREINVLRQVCVRDVYHGAMETVPRTADLDNLLQHMVESPHYAFFVVDGEGQLVGIVSVDDLRKAMPDLEGLRHLAIADDIMSRPPVYVREDETLDVVMLRFAKRSFEELPVLPAGDSMVPIGAIRRQDVINAYHKEIVKVDLGGSLSSSLTSATRIRSWETVAGYVMAQTEAPPHLCNRTLVELNLRQEKGVQIILVERASPKEGCDRFTFPTPDIKLQPGDRVILFGLRRDVDALVKDL